MIAWVSPALTSRSTPRRISRWAPFASSTFTCRSRISRVAISQFSNGVALSSGFFERSGESDVHVAVLGLDRVARHRLGGRRPGGIAGPHVETGPVQPALDRVVVHLALGQR